MKSLHKIVGDGSKLNSKYKPDVIIIMFKSVELMLLDVFLDSIGDQ